MAAVKGLSCSVCGTAGPSDAHHILTGRTPGRKSPAFTCIPLCRDCHTGPKGIHGDRAMWNIFKATELGCLSDTIERLFYAK